ANEIASELKESALSLITSGEENEISSQSNSIVIKVEGEPFTEQYFNYRIALYKASGSETPEEDAFKLIKEEGFCYAFAKEHDLIPTKDEILAEVTNRRAIVESSEESHELAKVFFESMGVTEDEYWNELTRKYEVPGMITRYNVEKYLEDNKLPELDIDAITYEIINQEYFKEIGIPIGEIM
ncbi:MAG: hypothetical protein IJC14_00905, partial [Firmicutes bacterium]|nr:hypothetical protein [Bacillota bacterium]